MRQTSDGVLRKITGTGQFLLALLPFPPRGIPKII
jgi:hypothetical protein